jgi:tyrosyl-tRNA synthetase
VLQAARPDESNSGLRRLISQGAVLVGGAKKTDPEEKLELIDGTVLRSGRRIWHRIRTTG